MKQMAAADIALCSLIQFVHFASNPRRSLLGGGGRGAGGFMDSGIQV